MCEDSNSRRQVQQPRTHPAGCGIRSRRRRHRTMHGTGPYATGTGYDHAAASRDAGRKNDKHDFATRSQARLRKKCWTGYSSTSKHGKVRKLAATHPAPHSREEASASQPQEERAHLRPHIEAYIHRMHGHKPKGHQAEDVMPCIATAAILPKTHLSPSRDKQRSP